MMFNDKQENKGMGFLRRTEAKIFYFELRFSKYPKG